MDEIWRSFLNSNIGLPLFGSLFTGVLIGFEREVRGKPAGLRTHALVCFASTLLTLAAARQGEWAVTFLPGAEIVTDPARMAHGILTGVGFLGAGVIFREGPSVQGLTTAASLWMASALGVLYGVGMYGLALAGAVTTLTVLVGLRLFYAVLPVRLEVRLRVVADCRSEFGASALRDLLRSQGLAVRAVSQSLNLETNHMEFTSTTWFRDGEQGDRLTEALKRSPGVSGFAVVPVEDDAAHGTSWLALSSPHG